VRHTQSLFRRRLPLYPGYDPNGIHDARNNADTANVPYNFVPWNPTTWLSTCFVGNRGSIHWTANIFGTSNTMAYLGRGTTSNLALLASNANATFSSVLDKWITPRTWSVDPNAGMNGFAITNTGTQSSLNLSAPFYSRFKFISNSVTTRTQGSSIDETTHDSIELRTVRLPTSEDTPDSKAIIHMFCSAGTDFNLIFFLNCPTLYYYDAVPNAGT